MNTPTSPADSVDSKLRASRLELLDIGLRNNLVSFRKTSKSLAVQGSDGGYLLDTLIDQQKTLTWEATGKKANANPSTELDAVLLDQLQHDEDAESNDDFDEAASPGQRKLPRLCVKVAPETLFLQLLKICTEANTLLEEQGANLLFLAIGFLHWHESDASEEVRRAPLVLVPCTLKREGASTEFELQATDDDVVVNLSLAAKLKTDFGITLPLPKSQLDDADDGDMSATDWRAYLDAVEDAIRVQKRWSVQRDDVVLGLFSFGKFLMFRDLASENWPEHKKPEQHPVLSRLMGDGFGDEPAAYAEDQHIDAVISPGDVHFVKDADSSQTLALLEACAGRNLVIQGPPGTGKSQTITNLIAELLAQKKTVLFVAEKMAALEVVKRRLDECLLGDAVLELHSHRATKSAVLKALRHTLELGRPIAIDGEQTMRDLQAVQQALNQYCAAVAQPVGASNQNFAAVLGQLLKLQRQYPELRAMSWPQLAQWPQDQVSTARDVIMRMALVIKSLGRPQGSAFWGTTLERFSPIEQNQSDLALQQGHSALNALTEAAQSLSVQLQLSQPASLKDMDVVCRAARRAAEAPRLDGIQLSTHDWQQRRDALKSLTHAGKSMQALRQKNASVLIDAAWHHNVLPLRQAIATYGDKWWKVLSGEWRSTKKQVLGLLRSPRSMAPAEMLTMVDEILSHQNHKKTYDAQAMLGQTLFGAQWQAEQSQWDVLERVTSWIVSLHDDIGQGQLPASIVAFLAGHPDASGLGGMADDVSHSLANLRQRIAEVVQNLGLTQQAGVAQNWEAMPLTELSQALDVWEAQLPQLQHVVRLNALLKQGAQLGLNAFNDVATQSENFGQLLPLFDVSRAQALVAHAYQVSPELAQFDRLEHEHRIAQFRNLDLASLNLAKTQLASAVWARMPRLNQPGEMAVLSHELNKKRRHMPIRQLVDRAGRAIQQIKPVFMMSPMSIANFLPPGKLEFDVVIFDEASQVKAVDALGAIMRGKQVIVVGDTRQMPPTDFFSREMEQEEETSTSDIESILSMFKARGCNERYLRWHYRSRHESLIAVSNAEFYDNRLVIFPSAGVNTDAAGISLTHLPHAVYDRGRTRTNKIEAQAVAQEVMRHAVQTPHLSLGVAAFSVAQRDLISVEIEMMRRTHPEAEGFFATHANEPFFVKNLENIQGDERDVMFISIGYGRNESGRIAKEFGPLNRDGGHRRLNVLITRAKLSMRVFSNFTADELELDASAKHGVRALKNLLKYAQTRELEVATETGRAPDSPFEEQVLHALQARGYSVEPQVGTAGYFIDMAVRDPEQPGRYLLAIECDGAAYHSSLSARDRDRLRQSVLEGLGWSFHRIWSTDWFRNPGQETERAIREIEAARVRIALAQPMPAPVPVAPEPVTLARSAQIAATSQLSDGYRLAVLAPQTGRDLVMASAADMSALIRTTVEAEAPIHVSMLARRVMAAYDVSRAGSRITARITEALQHEIAAHQWRAEDDFVYLPAQLANALALPVRDRSALPASERKLELVSPLEIQSALVKVIKLAFSLPRDDLAGEAAQILGFGRTTAKTQEIMAVHIQALIQAGHVSEDADGKLTGAIGAIGAIRLDETQECANPHGARAAFLSES